MLGIYTFVFGSVLKSRWSTNGNEEQHVFALVLFAGLLVFNIFSECVTRAPSLVISNATYVKKILFPLEILPWVNLFSVLFHAAISLAIFCVAILITTHHIPWTIFFLPFILLPLIFFCLGLSWLLASLGAYVRDIGQIMGVITSMLLFISAVFFPSSALPEKYRDLFSLNPLVVIIEASRDVMINEVVPPLGKLTVLYFVSLILSYLCFIWFQKSRRGFADVI